MDPKPQRIPRTFIPTSSSQGPGKMPHDGQPIPPTPSALHTSQEPGPSETKALEDSAYLRHEHRGDKKRNWTLTPGRPFLILGDSNTFPNVKIRILVINVSEALPLATISNVVKLNQLIMLSCRAILQLPSASFQTDGDLIHWTWATGTHMWNHWQHYFAL